MQVIPTKLGALVDWLGWEAGCHRSGFFFSVVTILDSSRNRQVDSAPMSETQPGTGNVPFEALNGELAAYRFGQLESQNRHFSTQLEGLRTRLDQLNVGMEVLKTTLAAVPPPGKGDICRQNSQTLINSDARIAALEARVDSKLDAQGKVLDEIKKKVYLATGALLAINTLISFLPTIIKLLQK